MAGQQFYFKGRGAAQTRSKRASTARATRDPGALCVCGCGRRAGARKRGYADSCYQRIIRGGLIAIRRPRPRQERAVLTKTTTVGGSPVTIHSFNGRLWASDVKDIIAFEERAEREIRTAGSTFMQEL